MSKALFNRLSFGTAREVADDLGHDVTAPDSEDIVAALINAFGKIDQLEKEILKLQQG